MGTVLEFTQHIKIKIHPRDHSPAHVHVVTTAGDAEMKILLETLEVDLVKGFSRKAAEQIYQYVVTNQTFLMERWNEIHKDS